MTCWRLHYSLSTVMEYAAKQKEHHRENRLVQVYERFEDEKIK